jgi:hypothetical protein
VARHRAPLLFLAVALLLCAGGAGAKALQPEAVAAAAGEDEDGGCACASTLDLQVGSFSLQQGGGREGKTPEQLATERLAALEARVDALMAAAAALVPSPPPPSPSPPTPPPPPPNDGSTVERAAARPADIRKYTPLAASSVYWLKPPAYEGGAFRAFIDFEKDGGGWVLVSKWGGYEKSVDRIFSAAEYDTTGGASSVLSPEFAGYSEYARLSRSQMNALWNISSHVARLHFQNDLGGAEATSGVYFQSKDTNAAGFDFWAGHYNAAAWADGVVSGVVALPGDAPPRYRSRFMLGSRYPAWSSYTSSEGFDPATNHFEPSTYSAGGGIGAWDYPGASVDAPGYGPLAVTRHAGFFGDITTGNQWLLTINPYEPGQRFQSNEPRQSLVFLRCA